VSLTTFAELKAAALSACDSNTNLTDAVLGERVALVEAKLNRRLRTRRQVTRTTLTIDAETESVPADFLAVRSIRPTSGSQDAQLTFVSVDAMTEMKGDDDGAGEINAFSVEGGSFVFWKYPSGSSVTAQLVYYARVPALSDAATTNWLLTYNPDAYYAGVVAECWAFLGNNPEEELKWAAKFEGLLEEIQSADKRETLADRLTPQIRATIV
jgi:hypothetical protein